MRSRLLTVLILAWLLAACSAQGGGPSGGPGLHVANGMNRPVLVYLNGTWLGTYAAGATVDSIPVSAGLPWHVEARLQSGRTLLTLDVASAGVSVVARADLSCGEILISAGGPRTGGPPPAGGSPGDCT